VLNIAELLTDPDFVQNVTINRRVNQLVTTGDAAGEVTISTFLLTVPMCVQPIKDADDLLVLPEGQRSNKMMKFYSLQAMYCDDGDLPAGATDARFDVVQWGTEKYKLLHVRNWSDYGYYEAIGVNSERLPT
jgi:hypothetical protein